MDSNRIINNKSISFKNILYTPTNVSLYMHYHKHLAHDFIYKQNINLFKAPKIEKIVLNMTDKTIVKYKKHIIPAMNSLEIISGQKLKQTCARKSISTFKIRKKQIIGCKVDLRKTQMFCFLEKLVTIILPRVINTGLQKSSGKTSKPLLFSLPCTAKSLHGSQLNKCNLQSHVSWSYGLANLYNFPELNNYFEYYSNIKGIDITLVITNQAKLDSQLPISFFQIPIK